jgi:(E)-4-hydroxy-3-methylbut-2-enyl-diphosphate synthase
MRRETKKIRVGSTFIGGDAPVSVQGMTKNYTSDIDNLLKEIKRMVYEGAELVRLAVFDEEDASAIKRIREKVSIPIIADIHYSYKLALLSIDNGADKIRINPGNTPTSGIKEIIRSAKDHNIPIRIGVNSGSVKMNKTLVESMVDSAMESIDLLQSLNFNSIVIALKTPFVQDTIECYRKISEMCDYPLHIGVTEAGRGPLAESKSILGIGMLLYEGIGDTIRVSLTEPSWKEIRIGKAILQSLGLRRFEPEIISCPTCGRAQVNLSRVLRDMEVEIKRLNRRYPEAKNLKIAVMGCSVNGPGEAKQADIGIAGGDKKFALFKRGVIIGTYNEDVIVEKLIGATEDLLKKA